MITEQTAFLEKFLTQYKEKEKKNFISLSAFQSNLKKNGRELLKISAKLKGKELENALRSHLGPNLTILKGSKSSFLAFQMPPDDLVFDSLRGKIQKGPFSPGVIAQYLPMKKDDFINVLNRLIQAGRVRVAVKTDYKISIQSVDEPFLNDSQPLSSGDDLFETAFRKLDQGRIFVRICNLRRELGWETNRFDAVLRRLRAEGTIQLHAGDASTMTEDDVKQSFTDENHFFYTTLTWKK